LRRKSRSADLAFSEKLQEFRSCRMRRWLKSCLPEWKELIGISFLKEDSKEKYARLVEERAARLQLS
jgi:hypothetical protein